jgi:hypothetical protein
MVSRGGGSNSTTTPRRLSTAQIRSYNSMPRTVSGPSRPRKCTRRKEGAHWHNSERHSPPVNPRWLITMWFSPRSWAMVPWAQCPMRFQRRGWESRPYNPCGSQDFRACAPGFRNLWNRLRLISKSFARFDLYPRQHKQERHWFVWINICLEKN